MNESTLNTAQVKTDGVATNDRRFWFWITAIAIVAVVVRLLFWKYTGRVWEDALITILHAENARDRLGLTHFKVDEGLIHGFTSPLSVLIPLLGEWIHPRFGLDAMRLVSASSAAAVVFLTALILRSPQLQVRSSLIFMACGYLAIEHHQILWGMAGMETEVVTLVILMSIHALLSNRQVYLGLSLGLCMLARPDFALWAALVGMLQLAQAWRTRDWRPLGLIVTVALLVYLPWVAFTWLYYGSPVPNTIHAKSNGYGMWWGASADTFSFLREACSRLLRTIFPLFGPSFGGNGTGFIPLGLGRATSLTMMLMSAVGAASLLVRRADRAIAIVGFVVIFASYYLLLVPNVFGWYVVPFTAVCLLLASKGIDALVSRLPAVAATRVAAFIALGYVALFVIVLPKTAKGERNIQNLVENPVRISIGRWLNANTPRDATIAGEPLGYMGYYSRRTYYDYPGLASREVVKYVRTSGLPGLPYLVQEVRPDYLVLRDMEIASLNDSHHERWFSELYEPVRTWEILPHHRQRLLFPETNIDLRFTVYQRKFDVQREPVADSLPEGAKLLAVSPARIEGHFSEKTMSAHSPAIDGLSLSSRESSDADTGSMEMDIPASAYVAIPFLTGPTTYDLELALLDAETGAEIRSLRTLHTTPALPVTCKSWRYWLVKVPAGASGHRLTVRARDRSSAWGGWFAVGQPRTVDAAVFDEHRLQASKRPSHAPAERLIAERNHE